MLKEKEIDVYAVIHKDESVRASSRSGGFFSAISDYVLDSGGVVYGCILNEDFDAVHIRAENIKDRNKMRGSKYIQSKMADIFIKVKKDLENQRLVLFSGTSCQIAGLKNFLFHDYDNLICCDILCHGVPSKVVWHEFLHWQEKVNKSQISAVEFRNKKKYGWRAHVDSLYFKNGRIIDSMVFKNIFFGHNALRPSCYECKFKSIYHPSDITIGDFWGIEKILPEFDDNKGVSLVIVNTEKGRKCFSIINKKLISKKLKIENAMQPAMEKASEKPANRKKFWIDFKKHNFSYIAKKYGEYGILNKVKKIIKKIVNIMVR